jgi:hypothetical protein
MARPDIDAAIAGLAEDSQWKTRGELRRLSGHLEADERVRALARGMNLGSDGLVVVTTDRLVFFDTDDESDAEISFRWDDVASVEFRAERVKLSRVHDPAREGVFAGLRRFLDDTPLTLELTIPDAAELSGLYEALVLRDGPLEDRALLLDGWTPVECGTKPVSSGAREPAERVALRRWWRLARAEVRSGALPLVAAGWAVALATIVVGALSFEETSRGDVTTCKWTADWVPALILLAPPVAIGLVVRGSRRSRTEDFGELAGYTVFGMVILSLLVYIGTVLLLTGTPLC